MGALCCYFVLLFCDAEPSAIGCNAEFNEIIEIVIIIIIIISLLKYTINRRCLRLRLCLRMRLCLRSCCCCCCCCCCCWLHVAAVGLRLHVLD